jgi:hypothetical protein
MACMVLAGVAIFGRAPAAELAAGFGIWTEEMQLLMLGLVGALAYGLALAAGLRILGVGLGQLRSAAKPLPPV